MQHDADTNTGRIHVRACLCANTARACACTLFETGVTFDDDVFYLFLNTDARVRPEAAFSRGKRPKVGRLWVADSLGVLDRVLQLGHALVFVDPDAQPHHAQLAPAPRVAWQLLRVSALQLLRVSAWQLF
jgi:hypothetical protein